MMATWMRRLIVWLVSYVLFSTGASAQNISSATLGFDTVAAPVQGRLYLTTIPAFRNGKTLSNNRLVFANLFRSVRYHVRVVAAAAPNANGVSFPLSQLRVAVTAIRSLTGHNFRNTTTASNNTALGTTGTAPTATNGVELTTFEIIGGGGDNGQVELLFNLVCLPNSGTSNLVPGADGSALAYTGMNLIFSLWTLSTTNQFTFRSQLAPSPNFTMGVRNAIEMVLSSSPQVAFRVSATTDFKEEKLLDRLQQVTISSNRPFGVAVYTESSSLSNGNNIKTIPVTQCAVRTTTAGVGSNTTFQQLGPSASARYPVNGAGPGLDRPYTMQYRLTPGSNLLVPGGRYYTDLFFMAYQL